MLHLRLTTYDFVRKTGVWLIASALSVGAAGCGDKFFDPTQLGRFRPTPAVNVILDSLGVAEESPVAWENGEEPKPRDIVAVRSDYTLRSGDVVRISIYELLQEGAMSINDYIVSETGKISIPEVGVIQAAGLTETQLEQEIREILSPAVLKSPSITVVLLSSQQRMFSVLGGGVPQPGRYSIPRYDFRLTDALAAAGGPSQFNVSYIYVSRSTEAGPQATGAEQPYPSGEELEMIEPQSKAAPAPSGPPPSGAPTRVPQPMEPAEKYETQQEMLDLITPSAQSRLPVGARTDVSTDEAQADISASVMPGGFRLLVTPTSTSRRSAAEEAVIQTPVEFGDSVSPEPKTSSGSEGTGRAEWVFRDGRWIQVPVQAAETKPTQEAAPSAPPTQGQPQWVLQNGRWVQVQPGQAAPAKPPVAAVPTGPVLPLEQQPPIEPEWEKVVQTRLIKIPADPLLAGDPRYNIVVKPGDVIHVPVDIIGEFCITGNVNRTGYIDITGRPMTLKQAIAAAGGLGPLAWPKYCEVVRRIGEKKEEIVMVDLDKIASGEQPDFFIKPNDLINVGTHPTSRWRAVLRNSFRAAYGFAFVYDRNFADADYGESLRWPDWL
jgi:protein involved in polysaccharide export with SLBB domain